ncbi:MAG: hypothetical protein JWP59_3153, partial [Massilia sp.]|nr:hypothetical protein [Massilia sp.]
MTTATADFTSRLARPLQALRARLGAGAATRPARSTPPIGADFAAERLNLVQVAAHCAHGQMHSLRAAASVAYPLPREQLFANPRLLRQFVQQALASAPFAGRRAWCALAPADVRILPLTVSLAAGQSEGQAVARATREQLGADASDAVVDYYQIRSVDGDSAERQVLVAVAPQTQVLTQLASLEQAGLDPVALDIGPAAIARLLAAIGGEDFNQSVLLINFGVQKSYLTVIWGRRLMLDREIDFGETQLAGKLAQSLGLAPQIARGLMFEHGVGARRAASDNPAPPTAGGADIARVIREILHPEFRLLAEELLRTQVYVASRTRGSTLSRVYLNGSLA